MNKKYFKKIITLFLFIITMSFHFAHSLEIENNFDGGQEGNGGDAIVCRNSDGSIKSAQLLDYYEGEVLRDIYTDFSEATDQIEQAYFDVLMNRLEKFAHTRVLGYSKIFNQFDENIKFTRKVTLKDIPDSLHIIFPEGCQVEQVVIQKKPEFPEDKKYLINFEIWNKLSLSHRVGLKLHEIIYEEAIRNGAKNSICVRYFNSKLSSNKFTQMNLKQFSELLLKCKLVPVVEYLGIPISIDTIKFNENGNFPLEASPLIESKRILIKVPSPSGDNEIPMNVCRNYLDISSNLSFYKCEVSKNHLLKFYSETTISDIHFASRSSEDWSKVQTANGTIWSYSGGTYGSQISWYKSGYAKTLSSPKNRPEYNFDYFLWNGFELSSCDNVHFYETGNYKSGCILNKETEVPTLKFKLKLRKYSVLNLYENQTLEMGELIPMKLSMPAGEVYISGRVTFQKNGWIDWAEHVYQDSYLKSDSGDIWVCSKASFGDNDIRFNEEGYLIPNYHTCNKINK